MDIEDSFTEEAIAALSTNVEGDDEQELREIIKKIYVTNEINWSNDHLNVAVLAFVAGRTNWADREPPEIALSLPAEIWKEFIQFMIVQRGTP